MRTESAVREYIVIAIATTATESAAIGTVRMIGADTLGSGITANGIAENTISTATAITSIVGGSALKTKTESGTADIAKE
jgi:hypothetical protein